VRSTALNLIQVHGGHRLPIPGRLLLPIPGPPLSPLPLHVLTRAAMGILAQPGITALATCARERRLIALTSTARARWAYAIKRADALRSICQTAFLVTISTPVPWETRASRGSAFRDQK